MTTSRKHRPTIGIMALVIVAGCTLVATLVLTSRSSADADQAAINAIIASFQQAEARQTAIPADTVAAIEAKRAELATTGDASTRYSEPPVHILPISVREEIDRASASRLMDYCSTAYQGRHEGDELLSGVVEAGLYNNPREPLVVQEEMRVLASTVMRNDGDTAIAWVYSWWGDVTTEGKGGQSWDVVEYRMVKEGGQWRVDGRTSLVSAERNSGDSDWGPYASHTSIASAEQEGPSALYPVAPIPSSDLDALQAIADAQAAE